MRALFGGLIALVVMLSGCTGEDRPDPRPSTRPLSIVSPTFPKLFDPRPVEWDSVRVDESDDRSIEVTYEGGIDWCFGLTAVSIEGDAEEIRLSLNEGRNRSGQICPLIALRHTVDILLSEPVGDRRIVNAAVDP